MLAKHNTKFMQDGEYYDIQENHAMKATNQSDEHIFSTLSRVLSSHPNQSSVGLSRLRLLVKPCSKKSMTLMLHLRHGDKQEPFLMLAHDSTLFAKRDMHTGQKMLAYNNKADKVHVLSSFVPVHQGSLFCCLYTYIHRQKKAT